MSPRLPAPLDDELDVEDFLNPDDENDGAVETPCFLGLALFAAWVAAVGLAGAGATWAFVRRFGS